MPLYEYNCEKCDETFEVIVSKDEMDKVTCPKCEKPAKKMLSGFAIGGSGSRSGSFGGHGGGCSHSGGG